MPRKITTKARKKALARRLRRRPRRGKTGRRRRYLGRRRFRLPSSVGSLPAGYTRQSTSYFFTKHLRDGILACGADLVYGIPDSVQLNTQECLFALITCNPCYWQGTRVASIAQAYQNYRPIRMRFRYVPQVAVTTPGIVVCGSIWNTPTSTSSLQQTLVTSNGGRMCQCYVPFTTTMKLGTNLQQNLYQCAGNLDVDHNPFIFAAIMRGTNVTPGYFFVEYAFEFKNAIGMAIEYTSARVTYPDTGLPKANKSIVTLQTIAGLSGAGLVADLESNGEVMYNGSVIYVPTGLQVMVYSNQPLIAGSSSPTNATATLTWAPPSAEDRLTGKTLAQAAADLALNGYAIYDVTDDSNQQIKNFAPNGTFGYGVKRVIQGDDLYIGQWTTKAAANGTVFQTYEYDKATQAIGQLLTQYIGYEMSSRENFLSYIPIMLKAAQFIVQLGIKKDEDRLLGPTAEKEPARLTKTAGRSKKPPKTLLMMADESGSATD